MPKVLEKMARDGGDARTLVPVWAELVGEQAARNSKPHELRDGTLEVAVTSTSWARELSTQADDILARLQARLGRPTVRRIVFVHR
jgi:predicted nucleic acid-binding Zn ribbon protein